MKENKKDEEYIKENENRLAWKTLERNVIQDCRIFEVHTVKRESSLGTMGTFVQLNAPNWVTVVPVVKNQKGENRFLMVEQYRHGNEKVTIEFPAGTVEKGEDPEKAGYRELLEETGFHAGEMIKIGEVSPNPAFMNNRVHIFAARNMESIKEQELDEHEMIDVHVKTIDEVVQRMGTGLYDNGIMMIALAYYLRWNRNIDLGREA